MIGGEEVPVGAERRFLEGLRGGGLNRLDLTQDSWNVF